MNVIQRARHSLSTLRKNPKLIGFALSWFVLIIIINVLARVFCNKACSINFIQEWFAAVYIDYVGFKCYTFNVVSLVSGFFTFLGYVIFAFLCDKALKGEDLVFREAVHFGYKRLTTIFLVITGFTILEYAIFRTPLMLFSIFYYPFLILATTFEETNNIFDIAKHSFVMTVRYVIQTIFGIILFFVAPLIILGLLIFLVLSALLRNGFFASSWDELCDSVVTNLFLDMSLGVFGFGSAFDWFVNSCIPNIVNQMALQLMLAAISLVCFGIPFVIFMVSLYKNYPNTIEE